MGDKLKLYLAAAFKRGPEMSILALSNPEFDYTCRWVNKYTPEADEGIGGAENPAMHATQDLSDILECDVFVCFAEKEGEFARGGKHFETGFAWGCGKWCVMIGPYEHIFQSLGNINHFDTWEECKAWLLKLETPLGMAFQASS